VQRSVLTVHGQQITASGQGSFMHEGAAHDQGLLVGHTDSVAGAQGRLRAGETRATHDGGHHGVGAGMKGTGQEARLAPVELRLVGEVGSKPFRVLF
jgi:hypothetical protein